jgi:hypothetical protein
MQRSCPSQINRQDSYRTQAEEVDLKFLSYRYCFSLALASGRRLSEVHAFSTSNSCLRFSRDKSSVTLETPFLIGIKSLLLVLERKEAALVK